MIDSVSRRAFSGSSGTYNVRASELARDRRLKTLSAVVLFLDDSTHTFHIEKRAKGHVLLEQVFQHLELIEKDYFGLQFSDNGAPPTAANADQMRWLDPSKPLKKQLRNGQLYFRVKFYVSDPSKLQEEYTRYHFYLQIRHDIMQGRLQLPPSTACLLASYTVQSELGDYNPEEHGPGYLHSLPLVPGLTDEMEKKIAELHKLHKGQTPADAEFNFLDHAKRMDMYGVDLHRARQDSTNKEIHLGVTSVGLVVFQNNIRINTFSWSKIVKISFKRKQFFIQLRREPSESYDTLLGFNMSSYRSSKGLWKACVEHHSFFRLHSPHVRARRFPLSLGSRFSYSGRTEFQTVQDGRQRARLERHFIRSPSKQPTSRQTVPASAEEKARLITPARASRAYDNKVTSLGAREPRRAWGEQGQQSDDEGGFLERGEDRPPFSGLLARRPVGYADEEQDTDRSASTGVLEVPTAAYSESQLSEEGLVSIRIVPDEGGRFGFNVKGGADLNLPILVSRVAPNTPADHCFPKLHEGDQVLLINGHDISGMLHEQVVNLIRASRDSASRELVLTVRPNVYEAAEEEEPPYQYVPDLPHAAGTAAGAHAGADALEQSMLLLADGLESGALVAQFEQLYRKKPGLTANEAKKPENVNKNRYRDISPYDATRVILLGGSSGDYINANYVNMEITGSGIVNRYIATQGPLPNTVADFWQMVSESQSPLVVMVTPVVERGRVKCHKYWPSLHHTLELAHLHLTCTKEEEEDQGTLVTREFRLTNVETEEERHVSHIQYLAWPDHGVPEDSSQFLSFAQRVRRARAGAVEPTIVHCSAGIGRTGVLILMETAMCLVEANEPVYPLDIVKAMRDQRAMMIQTPGQYRFVCESVHRAFNEGIVKPLPEFQR